MIDSQNLPFALAAVNQTHHKQAYQALWQAMVKHPDVFERRKQLDNWLKQHGHPLLDGVRWENELREKAKQPKLNWRDEYAEVICLALQSGYFYSDAFQKQLHHIYVETGRLSLIEQESVHESAILSRQIKTSFSQRPSRTLFKWLGCFLITTPLLTYFIS